MAKDKAKLRIGGDAGGASRAASQTAKGLKKVGTAGKQAARDLEQGAKKAAREEKHFEQEVQKVVQRLKRKETQTKATEEAMRRLGRSQDQVNAGGGPGGGRRPRMRGAPRPVAQGAGGMRPQVRGAFEGLSRMQGGAGGMFGNLAGAVGAGGALAGVGIAAAGVGLALNRLRGQTEQMIETATKAIALEHQRADATKAALDQLGAGAMTGAAALGDDARRAMLDGASLSDVVGMSQAGATDAQTGALLAKLTAGMEVAMRDAVVRAYRKTRVVGGHDAAVRAAEFASGEIRRTGGLGKLTDADIALEGMGRTGDPNARRNLGLALSGRHSGLNTLEAGQYSFATRESRAQAGLVADQGALDAANASTTRAAADAKDPVGAAMREINKSIIREAEVLERVDQTLTGLNRVLEKVGAFASGREGYSAQAARLRAQAGGG